MVVCQGDVFWANLYPSRGSEPRDKRPVVVVQRDSINRSKFQTVVVVPLTKQIKHADIPGNVFSAIRMSWLTCAWKRICQRCSKAQKP